MGRVFRASSIQHRTSCHWPNLCPLWILGEVTLAVSDWRNFSQSGPVVVVGLHGTVRSQETTKTGRCLPVQNKLHCTPLCHGAVNVCGAHEQATGKSPEPAGWKACATQRTLSSVRVLGTFQSPVKVRRAFGPSLVVESPGLLI